MRRDRPLFVPLKTEWFRAFERGEKTTEYRLHGPGWNDKTCTPGRAVTLSHGYTGSGGRIKATIVSTDLVPCRDVPGASAIYPASATLIAIHLKLEE